MRGREWCDWEMPQRFFFWRSLMPPVIFGMFSYFTHGRQDPYRRNHKELNKEPPFFPHQPLFLSLLRHSSVAYKNAKIRQEVWSSGSWLRPNHELPLSLSSSQAWTGWLGGKFWILGIQSWHWAEKYHGCCQWHDYMLTSVDGITLPNCALVLNCAQISVA